MNIWLSWVHNPVAPPQDLIDKFADVEIDRSLLGAVVNEKLDWCSGSDSDGNPRSAYPEDPVAPLRVWLADVFEMDQNVGAVLDAIEERGLADDTLIVFTSDQGPGSPINNQKGNPLRCNMMGSSMPFAGGKHDLGDEGGVRVPLIVRWPGHIPAGRVDRETVVSSIDLYPTFASIAGATALVPADIDGEDVSLALFGKYRPQRFGPLCWSKLSRFQEAHVLDTRLGFKLSAYGEPASFDGPHTTGLELFSVSADSVKQISNATAIEELWHLMLTRCFPPALSHK